MVLLVLVGGALAAWAATGTSRGGPILVLHLEGTIGPAASDQLARGLAEAKEKQAALVVVRLDTPGGLESTMREMVQKIVASPVPVAVYVAPSGARAASAGTFLVLAAQFNSFRDPFVILAGSVPLAMFGALTMTFLKMPNPNVPFLTDGWTTTLNVYSQVGLVTLVGLVAKNGILIVEFANQRRDAGRPFAEALLEAAQLRLRPILMTSVATVAGAVPLVLASGAGGEARENLGVVVFWGVLFSTLLTLYVVPGYYALLARRSGSPGRVAARLEQQARDGGGLAHDK